MIAKELINSIIPVVSTRDDLPKLILLMDDYRINHLPLVDNRTFRGFISREMLYNEGLPDLNIINAYPLATSNCFVYEDQHFYEIVAVMANYNSEMVAVLNQNDVFQGVITSNEIFEAFSRTVAVQSPGGIIMISIKKIDYSLAEITRLIESDGGKILGCFLTDDPYDSAKMQLTLKLDRKEVSHMVATLERFNYKIIGLFQEEKIISNEKERLDILMKYLNI